MLECVNQKCYEKMLKSNRLGSNCITVSDKEFAISIAKENLKYWISKGMTKGVKHGNTNYSAVAHGHKANRKTNENSDDELELTQNHVNENEIGNEEDETDAIHSEELGKHFYSWCSIIKKLRAEEGDLSWDHGCKDAIAQAVVEAQSKRSSGGSTISSKSVAALDISKSDDQDHEFVECDEW
jgi:hypothetical protein